jgi:ferritin-like metal-binding protein YciE
MSDSNEPMSIRTSNDIFFDQLKDIHSVEEQVTETLPDLIGWATAAPLKSLLERHLLESQRHREEVREIFDRHDVKPGDDPCKAMEGLIEGGNQHIELAADATSRDLLLIAHTTRIAHYEVAAYGFASAIAATAGLAAEADALSEILGEEQEFLAALADIATDRFGVPVGGAR